MCSFIKFPVIDIDYPFFILLWYNDNSRYSQDVRNGIDEVGWK